MTYIWKYHDSNKPSYKQNTCAVRSIYSYSKNKQLVCQRSHQIRCILSSDIYPLLRPSNSSVEGGGYYYVLLSVVSSLPEMVYVCSSKQSALGLNLSEVVHQGPPVMRLSEQVLTGLPGIYTRMKVLTQHRSTTKISSDPPMISGTRLCLSFFLVVTSSNISQRKEKNNVRCKTSLYCKRGMTT